MSGLILVVALAAAQASSNPPPIIDMHIHAEGAADYGPPGQVLCSPLPEWPARKTDPPSGE